MSVNQVINVFEHGEFQRKFLTTKDQFRALLKITSLDPSELLVALHYLKTGDFDAAAKLNKMKSVEETRSKLDSSLLRLSLLAKQFVHFPSDLRDTRRQFAEITGKPQFDVIIGVLETFLVRITEKCVPTGSTLYRDKNDESGDESHYVRVQVVLGPDQRIYNICSSTPGSSPPDMTLSDSELGQRLRKDEFGDGMLLGRSISYQLSQHVLVEYEGAGDCAQTRAFQDALTKVRNQSSQGVSNHSWRIRFLCLFFELGSSDFWVNVATVMACAGLHNFILGYSSNDDDDDDDDAPASAAKPQPPPPASKLSPSYRRDNFAALFRRR